MTSSINIMDPCISSFPLHVLPRSPLGQTEFTERILCAMHFTVLLFTSFPFILLFPILFALKFMLKFDSRGSVVLQQLLERMHEDGIKMFRYRSVSNDLEYLPGLLDNSKDTSVLIKTKSDLQMIRSCQWMISTELLNFPSWSACYAEKYCTLAHPHPEMCKVTKNSIPTPDDYGGYNWLMVGTIDS